MKKSHTYSLKTNLHFGLLTILAALFAIKLQAQTTPSIRWEKTISGLAADGNPRIYHTADGGYILGGMSNSGIGIDKSQASNGSYDYWVIKLDAAGIKQWDKSLGGPNQEFLSSLQQTSDGGYILGGRSNSGIGGDKSQPLNGQEDCWVVKLNANGVKQWEKSFGGTLYETVTSMQQTIDGGYILGAYSNSGTSSDKSQPSKGGDDFWLIKLDATGNKVWDKTIGGSGSDILTSLAQTTDGGYILGGYSNSGISGDKSQASPGSYDYWLLKVDALGNKSWDKTFGGADFDQLTSLSQTVDGGYILGGYSNSGISGIKSQASKGSDDYWIIKLDATGNKTWDKTIGGSDIDQLYSMQQTVDGGYILGGHSRSSLGGDKSEPVKGIVDYWVVKVDIAGNIQWDKTIGANNIDRLTALQQTSDGGYMLAGESFSGISGDKSQPLSGISDFWIVKLGGNALGFKESEVHSGFSVSPNPNQGKFILQSKSLGASIAEVTIYDLLGRVVLQQNIQKTNKQFSEELTIQNAKGMYILQLKAGKQNITGKIVVE